MLNADTKRRLNGMPKAFIYAWDIVSPYTMISPEQGFALWQSVEYIVTEKIPGCLVECGVWQGGSTMLMALALKHFGEPRRQIFMFDTFSGVSAEVAKSNLEQVLTNLAIINSNNSFLIKIVPGEVVKTLPKTQTLSIALLRLDTDLYDAAKAELEILYPKVSKDGVVIIDDYGHWHGAKKAVDQYFGANSPGKRRRMLWPLDQTVRGFVKSEDPTSIDIERYDRVPPGYKDPKLIKLFPHATATNPRNWSWKYLRPEVPHIARFDQRGSKGIGNATYEEACCLYTLASQFKGKRGLEVGVHLGWTGAHLLAAGLRVDFIDPAIANAERASMLSESFDAASLTKSYTLHSQPSPQSIESVFAQNGPELWSFAFIDGDHDGDAPMKDAVAVLPFMADDACVMFHDLTSPHVAAGLEVFQKAGWNIQVFSNNANHGCRIEGKCGHSTLSTRQ